ncbi:lysozyme inhibitor LprI family protein [uncultured Paracoccus sp.]|uniref:lysozyme inhibitor LprI family protein n=1 Tax=uncultured Paracoccus sp. TaxID=189685 RepID=UPI0026352FF6|nr:lysozyme inhibitor LprI family protein [uncultured Paracoccus sp.]
MGRLLAVLALALAPLPLAAGEASGIDPNEIEHCLSRSATDGTRLDCAGSVQASCLARVQKAQPDLHPVDRQLQCIDAEAQWWEAELNTRYARLRKIERARGAERAEALKQMERDWISFRDARCAYDRLTNGRGTGGAVAEPLCRMQETARQFVLLGAYLRDRGV